MELSILKYPFSYEILNLRSLKFQTNLRSRHFLAHVFHILLFILLPIPFTFVSYLSFSSRFSAPTIRLILPSIYHSIPFPSFSLSSFASIPSHRVHENRAKPLPPSPSPSLNEAGRKMLEEFYFPLKRDPSSSPPRKSAIIIIIPFFHRVTIFPISSLKPI